MPSSNNHTPGLSFKKTLKGMDIFSFLGKELFSFRVYDPEKNYKRIQLFYFAGFLAIWFCVNLLQSIFTHIGNDEAYYWMYARHLTWGYFDHPPMIALMIKAGGLIFSGELGVRIFIILSQIISLCFIWKIIDEKKVTFHKFLLFFGLAASIPLFQIYGFIATPDAALLLFITLFLFAYQKFISKNSIINIFLLSVAMAGLMYSKYHGGLIILLTVLSNLKLLLNHRFWIAAIFSIALFMPHIAWQIENNFPTFQFQMIDRMRSLRLMHFLQFWPNQFFAFNPFILIILATACLAPVANRFDRTLKILITGVFGFFWIISLWARVEPHWTAAASVPAIILLYKNLVGHRKKIRLVFKLFIASLILIFLARFSLIFDILPFHVEFLRQKEWTSHAENNAGDLPAAFINSYQKASVYSFYTGKTAFSLNNIYYRKNQFDLWDYEEQSQGKEAAILFEPKPSVAAGTILTRVDNFVMIRDTLHSFQKIKLDYTIEKDRPFIVNQTIRIPVEITNPYPYPVRFDRPGSKVMINAMFFYKGNWLSEEAQPENLLTILQPGQTQRNILSFNVPNLDPGTYSFGFCIRTPILLEAFNSHFQDIKVTSEATSN